jgi:uncharacterized membrane protein
MSVSWGGAECHLNDAFLPAGPVLRIVTVRISAITLMAFVPVHMARFTMRWLRGFEAHRRSMAKSITWRVTASLDTFLVSFIITGRVMIAGSIAGAEILTKLALYYFHERIWALVPYGLRPNE